MKPGLLLTIALVLSGGACPGSFVSLPDEDGTNAPVASATFENRLNEFVWVNWPCVEKTRIAETVSAPVERIEAMAAEMGLSQKQTVESEWKSKGYATLLRRNWNLLPYDQILTLLGWDRAKLRHYLLEDDYLFQKLGNLKPRCASLAYSSAEAAKGREERLRVARILREEGVAEADACEPRFSFIRRLSEPSGTLPDCEMTNSPFATRLQFSYFADYADPLGDDAVSSYPDGLLARSAAEGVNAVWLHVVLRTLAKDPFFTEFGDGCERRMANLRKLVERAARHGIKVYLYLNEPRPMPCEFFEKNDAYRECCGTLEWRGMTCAMCLRSPQVRRWVREATAQVFRNAPGLGGVFTISASENLVHCQAHGKRKVYENDPSGWCKPERFCKRCAELPFAESVADCNRLLIEGMHDADPTAKAIVWDWGWSSVCADEPSLVRNVLCLLPKANVSFMTVSEQGLPIDVSGTKVRVDEYSLSQVGPSEEAVGKWKLARALGFGAFAKAQVSSSWEMSVVPYVPVMDNVARHAWNLMKAGVDGAMLSWSCGCYPSPNLRVFNGVRTSDADAGEVLDRVAAETYGEAALPDVRRAWTLMSESFSKLPFQGCALYNGPHHMGVANPLYAKRTGASATMVGIPYDDLASWRGRYPEESYVAATDAVADGFRRSAEIWRSVVAACRTESRRQAEEELGIILTVANHYGSAADQARFVRARERSDGREMREVAARELARTKELLPYVERDSRLGYECSCQYFYVPQDLRAKIVNCRRILDAVPLHLVYTNAAPDTVDGWERWSLPIGNGHFGANVFGGVRNDRIQISHNAVCTCNHKDVASGLPNTTDAFELRLEFPHEGNDYRRVLDLDSGVASVSYETDGVRYRREYFASYPAKCLVMRVQSSEKGRLAFRLRGEIPFLQAFGFDDSARKGQGRIGTVVTSGNGFESVQRFEAYNLKVASCCEVKSDGKVTAEGDALDIRDATEATIVFSLDTNYRLDTRRFVERCCDPAAPAPVEEVRRLTRAATERGYAALRHEHEADYRGLFGRVSIDLGGTPEDAAKTTDALLEEYRANRSSRYLEALYAQYGRYLLISSSRPGTLGANLQGVWNCHRLSPWGDGYWHNINVQMNYWPAFSGNLAECFKAYADFNAAFRPASRPGAYEYVRKNFPDKAPDYAATEDWWCVGVGIWPYFHQNGVGACAGLTSKLFSDWYWYTRDDDALRRYVWPVVHGAADYFTRIVVETNGVFLARDSFSHEQEAVNPKTGKNEYYYTVGCAFDQQMIWENNHDLLLLARELGTNDSVTAAVARQIDRYDPVQIGGSGQVKEFREEDKYGEIGEYHHRHISQLVAVMPGSLINRETPEWQAGAKVALDCRGDESTGWALAHRLCCWSRLGDGNRAHRLLGNLIASRTVENLWDEHPPFQIDGNFGATAGVIEMLLQSQSGYIDLIPALPEVWRKRGGFRGLCARGAFEVDCSWKDGTPVDVNVRARAGGIPDVRHAGRCLEVVSDGSAGGFVWTGRFRR